MMCINAKAKPINDTNYSCYKAAVVLVLTNYTESISYHIMSIVVNCVGSGHTQTYTQKEYQESRHALACTQRSPGLNTSLCPNNQGLQ